VPSQAPAKTVNLRSTIATFLEESSLASKKRSARQSPAPSPQLVEIRGELRSVISKLKALGCEDSMVLVEFWHALDCVNGEDTNEA
jgi:hypothetical protein